MFEILYVLFEAVKDTCTHTHKKNPVKFMQKNLNFLKLWLSDFYCKKYHDDRMPFGKRKCNIIFYCEF